MNNLETRRNKINSCMAELFNLYMEDRKNIKGSISLDGVKCTLTFGENSKKEITDKKVMKLDDLKGVAINCKTIEQASKCCELASNLGLKWSSEEDYNEKCYWEDYREEMCYDFANGEYAPVQYYKEDGKEIKSAQWFLDNFTPKE